MIMDLALLNGQIFYKGRLQELNIGIENGKITAATKELLKAKETVDCSDKVVLPAAIDAHIHARDPGAEYKEDWSSASRAALHGGCSTVFDMPNNPGMPTVSIARLKEKRVRAERKSFCDFGLFFGLTKDNLDEAKNAAERCVGYKLYLGTSEHGIDISDMKIVEKIIKEIAKTGKIIVVHAESGEIISRHLHRMKDAKNLADFLDARPPEAEAEAVENCLEFAKDSKAKIHFAHVSTKKAVTLIRQYKQKGVDASAEASPNHIFFNVESEFEKPQFGKAIPPLREPEDQKAILAALKNTIIDFVATDHAPHTLEEKSHKFPEAPSGMPWLDYLWPIFLNEISEKRFDLATSAKALSENPAKRFGISAKGGIEIGKHADLTVVNLYGAQTIEKSALFTKCKWHPLEGAELKGVVEKTFVRGMLAFDTGKLGSLEGIEVVQSDA